jgi:hypothetical protein
MIFTLNIPKECAEQGTATTMKTGNPKASFGTPEYAIFRGA